MTGVGCGRSQATVRNRPAFEPIDCMIVAEHFLPKFPMLNAADDLIRYQFSIALRHVLSVALGVAQLLGALSASASNMI